MPRLLPRQLLRLLLLLAMLFGGLVNAAMVTADQVKAAILASPTASAQMKSYASAIGSLAMIESSGNTAAYNGSCCYGVLQMNTANIQAAMGAGFKPQDFQNLPLQTQVDAWAKVMSPMLDSYPVKALQALGVFDGHPVDAAMALACTQLGAGNCMRMIVSRSCGGFSDSLGTTICKMANKIAGRPDPQTPPRPANPSTPGTGTGSGPGVSPSPCSGSGCGSASRTVTEGFQQGSGVKVTDLRSVIQAICVAVTLLVMGSCVVGLWRAYSDGTLEFADLVMGLKQTLFVVFLLYVAVTFF